MEISGNFTSDGQVNIYAVIKSYKPVPVQNVKVTTTVNSPTSKLIEFEQNIDSIDTGESKNVSYSFTLPKMAQAGLYTITLVVDGDRTRDKVRTFTIPDYFVTETTKQPLCSLVSAKI